VLACARRLLHGRRRGSGRRGSSDHGRGRTRAPRRLARADRLRGPRRRGRAGVPGGRRGRLNAVVVAPDSFKGTLSAAEVAAAVARGLRRGGREPLELPVGDGGEGTLDALAAALPDAELLTATVSDPLGRPVEARFALYDRGRRGIVEMAEASGLRLVAEDERDAFAASTGGTGELIAAAVAAGASEVTVCVGGSATTDGGAGALKALDDAGVEVPLIVACDVRT